MRVTKYENGTDSIIFIQQPKKHIVKKVIAPIDTISLENDLQVGIVSQNLQANSKGQAHAEIKVKNIGNVKYENVHIFIECSNASREWQGNIEANSELSLSFTMPARFSTAVVRRNIVVRTVYNKEQIEKNFTVAIKRYTPVRSR